MSAFIKYFNCFFIQFFGLRVIYFILNILIMGSFFSTEDRHFFVLRQKQRTLGKLAICIYFSFLFLQGKILIVISQLSSDDFRLSLKQLNYVRIMLFQLFDKNQQDQEEAFTVFLKPNIKHLFQLLMLRSARFNKDTINKTTTKCSYVVLKLYFLIVVLIAHFGQSMPVSQPYLALDHHYVLQVDRAVNHFMLLEDRKTLEEGEKGVNDLLFRKLAVRASSLSYFDLFQKRGLLFGVEDTLVESDAFQQIGMRNLFFGVLRRVEVTVEFARLFVHEENFLGLVFYQCERMGIKFPHLFLFIIFMFHKRYKDSRQITCVKLAIDFADLQFFAKVAYLFKIQALQKAPNMLLNAHGSN